MAWAPDSDGVNGVYLARDVVHHAGRAMELCMRQVAPRIMSWAQLGEAAVNIARRRGLGHKVPEYVPDWTRCVDHFLIHAGEGLLGCDVVRGWRAAGLVGKDAGTWAIQVVLVCDGVPP